MSTTVAHLSPGTLLYHDNYRINNKLGQGGFGITYQAVMVTLNKEVVIKELFFSGYSIRDISNSTISIQSLEQSQYEEVKARFIKEGQTLAAFDHHNIVRVSFIFEENNTVYLVMEYIRGDTLRDYIDKKGKLPVAEALDYVTQIANALEVIHEKNILHRDIKPSNIIITPEGRAVLIDFGIAKQFADNKTVSNTGAHTPGFAPIEQYSGRRKLGPFTDIYSLSATLYYTLTGSRPMDATDRVYEDLKEPILINPEISPALNEVILKGMAIKSDDRYQTIAEFRKALQPDQEKPASVPRGFANLAEEPTKAAPPKSDKIRSNTIPENEPYLDLVPDEEAATILINPHQKAADAARPGAASPAGVKAATPDGITYGGAGKRFLAYLLDMIFLAIMFVIFAYVSEDFVENTFYYIDEQQAFYLFISVVLCWFYFAKLESGKKQGTWGKQIMGLQVTDDKGKPISFAKATGRHLGKIISWLVLAIGFLVILGDKKKQGLHDKIASTLVLQRPKVRKIPTPK